jgi:adenosylcobinamide-GDP ribazoletransferase
MWQPLAIAVALLTRFPVPRYQSSDPRTVGRSVLWYPPVGLLVGLVLAGVCFLTKSAPALVGAALALLAWCTMTGGLHLDGLSDSTDALIGSHGDSARALEIMKDPSTGPMGVTAVCMVLIAAPVLGRAAVIALFLSTPYVRPQGSGAVLAAHLPRGPGRVVLLVVLATGLFAGGVASLTGAVFAFLFLQRLMMRTLGGATGDTTGALVEVTEAAALVSATL